MLKILVIYLLIGLLYSILIMAWFMKKKFIDDFKEFKALAFLSLIESLIWPIAMFQTVKILINMKRTQKESA